MTRWYRAYEGTVTDGKFGEVSLIAECSRSVVIATWHALLESAASVNSGGTFSVTPRRVAVILNEPISVIEKVFEGLAELRMIEGSEITAWKARQYESDSSTERSRRYRERRRNGDATLQQRRDNVAGTACNAAATAPETETETETEKTPLTPLPGGECVSDERKAKGSLRYTAEFEEWWAAYPKKTGKVAAFEAYKRAKKKIGAGGAERLASAVKAFARVMAGREERFIPLPTTWLNQGRWEDDLRPARPGLLPHQIGRDRLGVGG